MKKIKELKEKVKETTKKVGKSIEEAQKDIKEGKSITEVGKGFIESSIRRIKETGTKTIKAQEWLDKNYPNKETSEIYINQQLEGILDCGEYKKLEKVFISTLVDRNKLEIKKRFYEDWRDKKIRETKIIPCILAQTWLDQNYPKNGTCIRKPDHDWGGSHLDFGKTRAEIKELDIRWKSLEGELNLSDFKNLEELKCCYNYLTVLNINNCKKLKRLECSDNQLTALNLDNLEELKYLECYGNYLTQIPYLSNPEKITILDIIQNNINSSDLTIFIKFSNLWRLDIGNWNENKIQQGIYNRFYGSLEPLKYLNKLERLNISNTDLDSGWEYLPDSLVKISYDTDLRPNCKLAQNKIELKKEIWADVHEKFVPKYKKEWLEARFSKEQTKKFLEEWKQAGVRPKDGAFINWFLNFKKLDLTWALENEEEFKDLRDKYKEYENFGICEECNQPNTSRDWCQSCNVQHFQEEFNNWTSVNPNINKFIQKCQLEATSPWNVLEWIPYEKFKNIEYIADGGFGKVYKAEWEGGSIERWNNEKEEWIRKRDYDCYSLVEQQHKYKSYKTVALKTLANSQNLSSEFLKELTLYKMFKSSVSNMVPCYGISKDEEGNYIMVMEYMNEGNLRDYLKEYPNLEKKLLSLKQIIQGLKDIHRKKLVHRDFHSGNIIVGEEERNYSKETICRITDLGLSKPVGEEEIKNTIYGVMPYVAPEVLRNQPYTQKSDIYSLGMIMYEILTDLPPYAEQAHDVNLALQICQGIRPKFPEQVKYPQLLIDLIKRCWDNEPDNRPTARKISEIVERWFEKDILKELKLKKDTEFYRQCEEFEKNIEERSWILPYEISFPTYQSLEIWHSKPINTKEITEKLKTMGYSEDLVLDFTNLNLEDNQKEQEQIAQIEQPSKQ
jgi:serine/threonine protein kinase